MRQVDARSQGVDDLGLEAVADLEECLFAGGQPRGERQAALDGHGYPLATRPTGRSGGTGGGVLLWRRGGLPGSLDTLKQRHPFCPPRLRSDSRREHTPAGRTPASAVPPGPGSRLLALRRRNDSVLLATLALRAVRCSVDEVVASRHPDISHPMEAGGPSLALMAMWTG